MEKAVDTLGPADKCNDFAGWGLAPGGASQGKQLMNNGLFLLRSDRIRTLSDQ